MRLLVVNNLFGLSSRGGAERVAELEAAGLAERGHRVVVVCGTPESVERVRSRKKIVGVELLHGETGSGLEIFTYQPPNFFAYKELADHSWLARLAWHWRDIFNGRSAAVLDHVVHEWRADVVHTHNLMGLGFAVPSVLCRGGTRQVHTVHDVQLLHPSGLLPADWSRPRWPHERAYVELMKRRLGSPETVFWPSEFVRDLHLEQGFFPDSKQVLLRNPGPKAVGGTSRSGREVGSQTFLFIGQLEEHKGVLDLLQVWSHLPDKDDSRLVVVGDGSLEAKVRQLTEGDRTVELRGRLDPGDLAREYDRADWLVVPSKVVENAPAVIGEALAHRLPVIGARSGGVPELIQEGKNGLLFEPGDLEGLVGALKQARDTSLEPQPSSMTPERHLDRLEEILSVKRDLSK